MRLPDFVEAFVFLALASIVGVFIYWAWTYEPRPFVDKANKSCIEHGRVQNIADGRVICRDGVVVSP